MPEPTFTITLERADWSDAERQRRVAVAYARILALDPSKPNNSTLADQGKKDRTPAGA